MSLKISVPSMHLTWDRPRADEIDAIYRGWIREHRIIASISDSDKSGRAHSISTAGIWGWPYSVRGADSLPSSANSVEWVYQPRNSRSLYREWKFWTAEHTSMEDS